MSVNHTRTGENQSNEVSREHLKKRADRPHTARTHGPCCCVIDRRGCASKYSARFVSIREIRSSIQCNSHQRGVQPGVAITRPDPSRFPHCLTKTFLCSSLHLPLLHERRHCDNDTSVLNNQGIAVRCKRKNDIYPGKASQIFPGSCGFPRRHSFRRRISRVSFTVLCSRMIELDDKLVR